MEKARRGTTGITYTQPLPADKSREGLYTQNERRVRILSVIKKYLNDTQTTRLWAKIKAGFVAKSGDTMTGALTLAGDPVSDLQAATKKYVDDNAGGLPSQTGQSGKFLTTDGTDASWAEVDALPSQTGKSGKFLTTNGSAASWADVESLPSQTGQGGKYLTTNGTSASWATVDALTSQSGKTAST